MRWVGFCSRRQRWQRRRSNKNFEEIFILRTKKLSEFLKERLPFLQIERIEPFGEPVVDRGQQFASLRHLGLTAPRRARLIAACPQIPSRNLNSRRVSSNIGGLLRLKAVEDDFFLRLSHSLSSAIIAPVFGNPADVCILYATALHREAPSDEAAISAA
jgi:hypothetical protein